MRTPLSTWFAHPYLLGLLLALPLLAWLFVRAQRRRRHALALLGPTKAVQKLQMQTPGRRIGRNLCLFAGLFFLVLGSAGPQWGGETAPRGVRRQDIVVVLDLSRSMLAEQPSRQEWALRALRHLAQTLAEQGGPRVALVVFAAHPRLVFPLTVDYDHFRAALSAIDADDLPPALRPQADEASGTRIGAALRLALDALETGQGGDIVLVSDGDDPAGDEEYLQGAEEARRRKIPVHVVAVGNSDAAGTIPFAGGVLMHEGKQVLTKLNEKPLQEIARRTQGAYIPAHTSHLPLGKLLPGLLASHPREGTQEAGSLPVMRPRYPWFLIPALLFLAATLVLGERGLPLRLAFPATRLGLVPLCVFLVSAAPLVAVDDLLRRGNEAFQKGDYDLALGFFEKAEERAPDPGLIAFNKGAAYYRLQRYAEAAHHYKLCLEDEAGAATAGAEATRLAGRRAQAWFQLGNSLLQSSQETERASLEQAIDAFHSCLDLKGLDPDLRGDARHNLELARLLWLKTQPTPPDQPPKTNQPDPKPKTKDNKTKDQKANGTKDNTNKTGSDEPGAKDNRPNGKGGPKSKKVDTGPLTVLSDTAALVPLSPQETEAHLEQLVDRILRERRQYKRHAVPVPDNVKDW